MEDLNNRQIVLLTMLTSFVISIGTGIVTVAMLEEAPQTVTQTVNRVVERTIERVVAGTSTPAKPAPVTTVTKEITIYAKEDDLVTSAVEKNQPRIVQIFSASAATSSDPIAIGFVVSRDGMIVTERDNITQADGTLRETYRILVSGQLHSAVLMKSDSESKAPIAFLRITDLKEGETLDAVTFGREVNPKVAQTVIVLGGMDGSAVFKTTLSKFTYAKTESTTTPPTVSQIDVSSKIAEEHRGGLVVNLDGQVVGAVVASPDGFRLVIFPASRILELVGAVSADVQATNENKSSSAGS